MRLVFDCPFIPIWLVIHFTAMLVNDLLHGVCRKACMLSILRRKLLYETCQCILKTFWMARLSLLEIYNFRHIRVEIKAILHVFSMLLSSLEWFWNSCGRFLFFGDQTKLNMKYSHSARLLDKLEPGHPISCSLSTSWLVTLRHHHSTRTIIGKNCE